MPSPTGYTGTEIITRITQYIGNTSDTFQDYMRESLPLAIFRFCKMHDWSFLSKTGLTLNTVLSQAEYELSVANIGFLMAASNVELIRAEADNVVLRKVDFQQMRRFDADNNDGSATDTPLYWAVAGENNIRIWPPSVKVMALKIDGKITPSVPDTSSLSGLVSLAANGGIPYKYQESLIEYMIAQALDRENDDRAPAKMQAAMALIRADILEDMRSLGDSENPRIKSLEEMRLDGLSTKVVPGFNYGD